MTSREERVAHNEATSREINEGIEGGHEGAPPDRYMRIVCECGQESCERLISITVPEYERVRADPRQFAVVRDHVMADMERRLGVMPGLRTPSEPHRPGRSASSGPPSERKHSA